MKIFISESSIFIETIFEPRHSIFEIFIINNKNLKNF